MLIVIGLGGLNLVIIESYIEVLFMLSGFFMMSSDMFLLNVVVEFENIDSFFWDFGDGSINSIDQVFSYIYVEFGVYELSFSFINSCGIVVIIENVSILLVLL